MHRSRIKLDTSGLGRKGAEGLVVWLALALLLLALLAVNVLLLGDSMAFPVG